MVAAGALHLTLGRKSGESLPKVVMKLRRFSPNVAEKFVQGNCAPSSGGSFYAVLTTAEG
jgi:hypothetical protein